jgi:hypothetical protein
MQILYFKREGINVDTMERFYIYNEATSDIPLTVKHINYSNAILQIITNQRGH